MSKNSLIQWTDHTWNVARGCTKVDADCKYCYMYRNGERYKYDANAVVRTKSVFTLPLRIKEPSRIFTSSLTDLFHPAIDAYRNEVWDIIRRCPQHTFQILTKRPERILDHLPPFWNEIESRCWLGTSVGHADGVHRIKTLAEVGMAVPKTLLFISFEPLHGEIPDIDLFEITAFSWVIIGGESGNDTGKYRYRECRIEWIESIVRQFTNTAAIFVKQMGTHLAKTRGMSDRHGGNIEEFPKHLQIRNFPNTIY